MPFGSSQMKWHSALVYLGDIIIFLRNADEHVSYARSVLSLLHKAGFTLNLENCNVSIEKIEYFGHVIQVSK